MCSRVSLPASIFEKSRISLIMPSSASPEVLAVVKNSRCSAVRSVPSASSVMPRMPLMGGGCADLMAHIGQEFTFYAGCQFGCLTGFSLVGIEGGVTDSDGGLSHKAVQ